MQHVALPYADHEHRAYAARLGMWLFLSTEVLFFAVLFTVYAWNRALHPQEFTHAAHHSNLVLGSVNTFVLVTSSAFIATAVEAVRHERHGLGRLCLSLTATLGLLFVVVKFVEYARHIDEGILPGAAYRFPDAPSHAALIFFTLYYVMTGVHALHMLVGIALVGWLVVRLRPGRGHVGLELVGLYWHFVDLVWLFLWPAFYLMR